MSKSLKPMPDDKEQSRLFIEKAREIGADEKSSAADSLLGRLAQMPPEPRNKNKQAKVNKRATIKPKKGS